MKKGRIFKTIALFVAMILISSSMTAQEYLSIVNVKPGKLNKKIPKKSRDNIKGLTISGPIDGKDLQEVYNLPNLKSLDLSEAILQNDGKSAFYIPVSIAFDTLKLPPNNWEILPSVSVIGKYGAKRRISHLWMYPGYDGKNYTTISNLTYNLHFYQYSINKWERLDMIKIEKYDVGLLELGIYTDRSDNRYWLTKRLIKNSYGMWDSGSDNIYDYPLFTTVYVPNRSALGNLGLTTLNTIQVVVEDEKDTAIVFYPFADSVLDLKKKRTFAPYAFSTNNNIYEVILNGNTPTIPHCCFYCCFNLRKVNLAGVKNIEAYAFSNTNINKVVIPASVKELDCSAFLYSKLDTIEFEGNTPPEITNWDRIYNKKRKENNIEEITTNNPHWDDEYGMHWRGLTIIVPEGAYQNYSMGFWKELGIITKGQKTDYELTITEPGTLALQLDNDMLRTAQSITIKGVLYDTDIEHLNKCKSLKNLDLSMCLVVKSPKTLQKEMNELQSTAYLYQVIGSMAVEQAEHEYEVGNMDLGDAMYSTLVGEYLKQLSSMLAAQGVKANSSCLSPKLEIKTLRHYKMPLQASEISGFSFLPNLISVDLPPDASVIKRGAFAGCMNLRHIIIPNSISYLENGAFDNCGLEEIDLSETSIREYNGNYPGGASYSIFDRNGSYSCEHNCPNLITVRLPKKAHKWYGAIDYGPELYIYSQEPPKDINLTGYYKSKSPRTIHVPKGCKLNYTKAISYRTTIVDDIEISTISEPEFVPSSDENNLSLYTADGDKILTFSNEKIYLLEIDNDAIVGEIRGNKLIIKGEEFAVFNGVSMYSIDGKEVAKLDGSMISCIDFTAVINGKKICNKNTGETIAIFNKTPNIKELLSSYVILTSIILN